MQLPYGIWNEFPRTRLSESHCDFRAFIDSEAWELVDIYFPAAMRGEKQGCVTNTHRSVNLPPKAAIVPFAAREWDGTINRAATGNVG